MVKLPLRDEHSGSFSTSRKVTVKGGIWLTGITLILVEMSHCICPFPINS